MSENWSVIAAEAGSGIAEVGQVASLVRTVSSGTAYNPTLTKNSYPVTVTAVSIKASEIDGTIIQRGDRMFYLSVIGLPFDPSTSDNLAIGGLEYSIIEAVPLAPAGTVVFWKIQARK